MMRRLALALLLTGCSPALTFRVDGPATDEQSEAPSIAAATWNAATNAKHKLARHPDGSYRISFPASIPTHDGPMGGRECTHVGKDCPDAPTIRVQRDIKGNVLLRVLLHEMGHALGLEHLSDPGAVMFGGRWDERLPATLTPADINECRRVGACKETAP